MTKSAPVELERRFEDERGEEDVEDQVARQRKLRAVRKERDEEPRDEKPDDVRQAKPAREHRDQAGNEEQGPDRGK